ncbi:hypothetical protein HDU83_001083 [Entophlyctis luteolus]|nr:hypothetical protein HDU83_001083 [Entophlyctis luteolus]KAJ3383109.1 hypothetical protein HDU84_003811 [Entophlyctis sp. JEL0112]
MQHASYIKWTRPGLTRNKGGDKNQTETQLEIPASWPCENPNFIARNHPMNFEQAAAAAKALSYNPTNDELLKLYALYKQATVGPNNTAAPGLFDLQGKAKWEAWNGVKNLSQDEAKAQYIAFVTVLQAK